MKSLVDMIDRELMDRKGSAPTKRLRIQRGETLPHATDLCPSRDHGGHIANAGRCSFCDAPVML